MVIRPFDYSRGRDYDEFRRIFFASAENMNVQSTEVDFRVQEFLMSARGPDQGLFLTAWDNNDRINHMLGFAILNRGQKQSDMHVAQLSNAVDPIHQGMGIGTSLVRQAISDSRPLGIKRVEVINYETSLSDRNWFENLGFTNEGRLKNRVNLDGNIIDAFMLAYTV